MSSAIKIDAVELLGDDNFGVWKTKMKYALVTKDLWSVVDGSVVNVEKDAKALAMIGLHVKNHHLPTLEECDTAKEAWEKLSAMFRASSTTRLIKLLRELNELKKESNETVAMYVNRAKNIMHELQGVDHVVKPVEMASRLLAGLPSDFDTLVMVLEGEKELDLDMVITRMIELEAKSKSKLVDHGFTALMAKKGRRDNKDRACWVCGKVGHISKDCPDKKASTTVMLSAYAL